MKGKDRVGGREGRGKETIEEEEEGTTYINLPTTNKR